MPSACGGKAASRHRQSNRIGNNNMDNGQQNASCGTLDYDTLTLLDALSRRPVKEQERIIARINEQIAEWDAGDARDHTDE